MRYLNTVGLCALLGGCVHSGMGTVAVGAACPPVKAYSARQQQAVRAELRSCGPGCETLSRWIADYYVLRAQTKACRGQE